MTGSILTMTEFVLYIIGLDFNMTGFVTNMARLNLNVNEFVLNCHSTRDSRRRPAIRWPG